MEGAPWHAAFSCLGFSGAVAGPCPVEWGAPASAPRRPARPSAPPPPTTGADLRLLSAPVGRDLAKHHLADCR